MLLQFSLTLLTEILLTETADFLKQYFSINKSVYSMFIKGTVFLQINSPGMFKCLSPKNCILRTKFYQKNNTFGSLKSILMDLAIFYRKIAFGSLTLLHSEWPKFWLF